MKKEMVLFASFFAVSLNIFPSLCWCFEDDLSWV